MMDVNQETSDRDLPCVGIVSKRLSCAECLHCGNKTSGWSAYVSPSAIS
jgi:hypothetical protein